MKFQSGQDDLSDTEQIVRNENLGILRLHKIRGERLKQVPRVVSDSTEANSSWKPLGECRGSLSNGGLNIEIPYSEEYYRGEGDRSLLSADIRSDRVEAPM